MRDISTFEVDRRILKNCLRDGKVLNIPNVCNSKCQIKAGYFIHENGCDGEMMD